VVVVRIGYVQVAGGVRNDTPGIRELSSSSGTRVPAIPRQPDTGDGRDCIALAKGARQKRSKNKGKPHTLLSSAAFIIFGIRCRTNIP